MNFELLENEKYIRKNNIKINYKIKINNSLTPNIIGIHNKKLIINAFDVQHGLIKATGYVFNRIAYISDCNKIPNQSMKNLFDLDYLIIDCLREKKHPSHFNLNDAVYLVKQVKPKKAILTNLHVDLDYENLKNKLPSNIIPAYDGLNFNF